MEKARTQREKAPVEFTCAECDKVFAGQLYCPACGTKVEIRGKMADYADGELVKMTNGQFERIEETITEIDRKRFYLGVLYWCREPRAKRRKSDPVQPRRKDGFAAVAFKAKFGGWPPRGWENLDPIKPDEQTLSYIRSMMIRGAKAREAVQA